MENIKFTISGNTQVELSYEDAEKYVLEYLRTQPPTGYSTYGYEVYLPNLIALYLVKRHSFNEHDAHNKPTMNHISPMFMDVCWDLCRRGILRPSTMNVGGQGSTKAGYSITNFGKQWLLEAERDDYVPTEPTRFAVMIAPFAEIFGDAFQARAQEAVKCYGAHADLACCAMAGAAAEVIFIRICEVIGVSVTEKMKLSQMKESICNKLNNKNVTNELQGYESLVIYWRDASMHHPEFKIESNQAFLALTMLLKLAIFAKRQWFDQV